MENPNSTTTPPINPPLSGAQPYTSASYPPQSAAYAPYRAHHPYSAAHAYEDEDGAGVIAHGASLVAVGGMLGLTAAAALRWLNGGDFQLLPPPSKVLGTESAPTGTIARQARASTATTREAGGQGRDKVGGEVICVNDDDNTVLCEESSDSQVAQQKLLAQMESLSLSMKSQASVQEKILARLPGQGSSITNESMNLLRASNQTQKNEDGKSTERDIHLLCQLVEIKTELKMIQQQNPGSGKGKKQSNSSERLDAVLDRLENCISTFEKSDKPAETKQEPVQSDEHPTSHEMNEETESPNETEDSEQNDEGLPETPSESKSQEPLTVRQAVRQLAEENEIETLRGASQLLYLYMINLSGNPKNQRYRKIFTTNESFKKVQAAKGGPELLQAVGFEEAEGHLVWMPDSTPEKDHESLPKLKEAVAAVGILKGGQPSASLTEKALSKITSESEKEPATTNDDATTESEP